MSIIAGHVEKLIVDRIKKYGLVVSLSSNSLIHSLPDAPLHKFLNKGNLKLALMDSLPGA